MIAKPTTADEWTALGDRMEQVFHDIQRLADEGAPLEQQVTLWREAAEIAEAGDSSSAEGFRRNIRMCEVLIRMQAQREEPRKQRRRWWRR